MSHDSVELIERYYASWSRQDADAVMDFFVDASVFEDLAFAAKFEGLEQIRGFVDLTYAGAPDFRVTPNNVLSDGIKLAAEWVMSGTHLGDLPGLPATGKSFEVRAVSVITLADRKIGKIVDYWNPLDFQRCVGLL